SVLGTLPTRPEALPEMPGILACLGHAGWMLLIAMASVLVNKYVSPFSLAFCLACLAVYSRKEEPANRQGVQNNQRPEEKKSAKTPKTKKTKTNQKTHFGSLIKLILSALWEHFSWLLTTLWSFMPDKTASLLYLFEFFLVAFLARLMFDGTIASENDRIHTSDHCTMSRWVTLVSSSITTLFCMFGAHSMLVTLSTHREAWMKDEPWLLTFIGLGIDVIVNTTFREYSKQPVDCSVDAMRQRIPDEFFIDCQVTVFGRILDLV
ncbi:hypothetical protein PFISCL1PPCAC_710, partial [Pristionchus fissidentatus]